MSFELVFLFKALVVSFLLLPGLAKTRPRPKANPFHAGIVSGTGFSAGVLITENYVIATAAFVRGWPTVTVYLGYQKDPRFSTTKRDPKTQIIRSSKTLIHHDFTEIVPGQVYLNNIALVELSKPARINSAVRPGHFMSLQEAKLLEDKTAFVRAWTNSSDVGISLSTARIRNKDTCNYLFEKYFLSDQQFCVAWITETPFTIMGNAAIVADKIVGIQIYTPECSTEQLRCSDSAMILSLMPFLNWMSQQTCIPIEKFTNQSPEKSEDNCNNTDLEEVKEEIYTLNETVQEGNADFTNLHEETISLADQIEDMTTALNNITEKQDIFSLSVSEKIKDINSTIHDIKTCAVHNEPLPEKYVPGPGNGTKPSIYTNITSSGNIISNVVQSEVNKQQITFSGK